MTDSRDLLAGRDLHDSFGFDELCRSYNYAVISDRRRLFVRLLHEEFARRTGHLRVLDIGCGEGLGEDELKVHYLRAIRERSDELWGVEPDRTIQPHHGQLTHFRHGTIEDADLPEGYFDIAYAFFVMEHVTQPESFMRSVWRVLRPGGAFLFITPNDRHYFVRAAKLLKRLGIADWYLAKVKGEAVVHDYHYPVVYRLNSEDAVRKAAAAAGLRVRGIAYSERAINRDYFWGPAIILDLLARAKRRYVQDPRCLIELIGWLEKQDS